MVTIGITDHLGGDMQITCSGRGTQRRPGEGCWRSSPETRGVWTNRTTGKPGLLGVREVGLAEGHLLPLTRQGVGRAGPSINSLLTVAHRGFLCAWFLMCEAKNQGTHLPWVCRISPGIQGSGHVSCACLLVVPLWLLPWAQICHPMPSPTHTVSLETKLHYKGNRQRPR